MTQTRTTKGNKKKKDALVPRLACEIQDSMKHLCGLSTMHMHERNNEVHASYEPKHQSVNGVSL